MKSGVPFVRDTTTILVGCSSLSTTNVISIPVLATSSFKKTPKLSFPTVETNATRLPRRAIFAAIFAGLPP